jgi:hypothetical protein
MHKEVFCILFYFTQIRQGAKVFYRIAGNYYQASKPYKMIIQTGYMRVYPKGMSAVEMFISDRLSVCRCNLYPSIIQTDPAFTIACFSVCSYNRGGLFLLQGQELPGQSCLGMPCKGPSYQRNP